MTNLTVPSAVQARLLEVLEFDTELIVLARKVRDAEAELGSLDSDAEYQRLVREAEAAEDRLDDFNRERDHLESDISIARARIERDRSREAATNDPKELSELEHEINSLERRIDMLESTELEVLDRRDAIVFERDEIVAARDSFHRTRDDRAAAIRAEIAAAGERRDAVARSRTALVAELPTELVELYERQRERYGVGASFLQRGITGASGVQLTPSELDAIRKSDPDAVLLCPDSNAILIRTAESGL
ncbi:MAG: hypothetical protein RLZZ40_60 [Actinomycetota bacterium]|jgi:predicted  nucleic acid-binding Zn-ribbon protein